MLFKALLLWGHSTSNYPKDLLSNFSNFWMLNSFKSKHFSMNISQLKIWANTIKLPQYLGNTIIFMRILGKKINVDPKLD